MSENLPDVKKEEGKVMPYKKYTDMAETEFVKIAGKDVWNRERLFALQIFMANPKLQQCDPVSIRSAILNIALTGATLNPALAQAYLVERGKKCCLDISYRGLIKIATMDGSIIKLKGAVIYDWDGFQLGGPHDDPHHVMNVNPPIDPEKMPVKDFWEHLVVAYSHATLPGGYEDWSVLPKWKLLKVMNTSKSKNSEYSPWTNWPDEMCIKTAIRYHSKTLPRAEKLVTAASVMNEIDGLDLSKQDAIDVTPSVLESLPEDVRTDITNLCDLADVSTAEMNMRLGQAQGDPTKLQLFKEELEQKASKKLDSGQ